MVILMSVNRNIASKARHLAEETSPSKKNKHPGTVILPGGLVSSARWPSSEAMFRLRPVLISY